MKFLINFCVIDIYTEAHDDNTEDEEKSSSEGHQVVFLTVITLTRLWTSTELLWTGQFYGDAGFNVPSRVSDRGLAVDPVTLPEFHFPPGLNDWTGSHKSVDDDTAFHGDDHDEGDECQIFGVELHALLLGLAVKEQTSMKRDGDDDQKRKLPLVGEVNAELQVAGREEVIENVEDSDEKDTEVL